MSDTEARLHRFHGGLRLPVPEDVPSSWEPLVAPPPERLVLPLHQHVGAPAEPVVRVGQRVRRGELIAEADGYVSAPVHVSTSGIVAAIEPRPVPHPSGLSAPCVVIDADGADENHDGYPAHEDFGHVDPQLIRKRVREAGIVGLGGAAFPSAVKLTAKADFHLGTLILNGAECEPYISCDEILMRTNAREIVIGAQIILHALQINACLIAIEDDKEEASTAVQEALESIDDDRLRLIRVPTVYPEGGERQLIQVLSGMEVPHDGLPMDIGYVCQNVGTAAAVYRAVILGEPLTARLVTVTGSALAQPCNVEVRLGTPMAWLIEHLGGYAQPPERLIMGGAMMGFALDTDEVPVVKATNCILGLSADQVRPLGGELPCIRCAECARVCPATLLPQQLYWNIRAEALERAQAFKLFDCIECGACDYVCPSQIPLAQYFRYAKSELWARERLLQDSETARSRFQVRNERLQHERAARAERRANRVSGGGDRDAAVAATQEEQRQAVIRAALERARSKKDGSE